MTMTDEERAQYITALIRERDMAKARGDEGRANDVTAELHRIGAEAAPKARRATRRTKE